MPWTHRKVGNKTCVYKKDTGAKVGCTKGPIKKYLAALHANVTDESKSPSRKVKSFKEYYETTITGADRIQKVTDPQDSAATAEATYADGQDETTPVQTIIDAVTTPLNKAQLISDVIGDLKDFANTHDWSKPIGNDLLKAMADTLRDVGIEPTDIDASIGKAPNIQKQYLITGPGTWDGSKGAIRDLIDIVTDIKRKGVNEDEDSPGQDLPMGTSDSIGVSESAYQIGTVIFDNPFGTGRKHYFGTDRIEATSPDDALNKVVRSIAIKNKIKIDPRILVHNAKKNGVKIKPLDTAPTKDKEYWWNRD